MKWKGILRLSLSVAVIFAFAETAWAGAPFCPLTSVQPSGEPVAILVTQIHDHWCSTSCPGPDVCCSSAASINLPAGQYVVTVSGQVCSTESPPCYTDGTPGSPHCIQTSDDGVCSGETNVCFICDPRHAFGGPVLINHAGGNFYAWRNDCYGYDNWGIFTFSFYSIPTNSPPIADAGPDMAIIRVGSTVQLDGTQSYDPDGDSITYSWTFVSKPEGSNAAISDPTAPNPTFRADIHGDYDVELVVSDTSSSSTPDHVVVSFENVAPVSSAGPNQSIVQGDTICFDGSGSSDANLDTLTYSWSIVSLPAGSGAYFDDSAAVSPCITTDLPGNYEVSLVVNDGLMDSAPGNATALAITFQDAITLTLQETISAVNNISPGDFKNENMQNALTNKLNAALELVDQGAYLEALDKLSNDILDKTDGCAASGAPNKNDWIVNCATQNQVYPLVMEAIGYLQNL